MELAFGLLDIARNHQGLSHAGFSGESSNNAVQCRIAFHTASDDVRHRFHAFAPEPRGKSDHFSEFCMWSVGDVDAGPRRNDFIKMTDSLSLSYRRLDRVVPDEVLDRKPIHISTLSEIRLCEVGNCEFAVSSCGDTPRCVIPQTSGPAPERCQPYRPGSR